MRERDLRSIVKKKFKKTTNSSHRYPVVENYLNQNFHVKNSKKIGISDITYIHTGQGWLYLTTVIDLFGVSRRKVKFCKLRIKSIKRFCFNRLN
ncbi:hypothetical protein D1631_18360 [Chryseobacterium nematophagum]|uniref:Integrase catalytic domain-containing protein n=1 Tax=Chryseobacterium nematophagum TaxID=2305228 RepID=A0A3M7TCV4_9FLAO|nr:hypothetical protein D1631_18360 [Chryseobacterium nematophagum]